MRRRHRDITLSGNVHVTMQPITRVREDAAEGTPEELAGFHLLASECDEQGAPRAGGRILRIPMTVPVAQLLAAATLDYLENSQASSPAPGLEVVRELPARLRGRMDVPRGRRG